MLDIQEVSKRVSGKLAQAVGKAKLHHHSYSPGVHVPTPQSAFTHISLNWTLIKLGDLDCQIVIAFQDPTTHQID